MKLTLERVKVADILPLVDEYGNEFLNRDYSLEVNQEYVHKLAASFGESGEPDEQVKLIRDGDVFRIKAGNSRVRAMKELGTEECWAVIDEDDTVQSVLETVVRTNTKKTYEPQEESKFVQQLAAFGDDEYVGAVASIGTEKASKMRRARKMAGERAETLSLDRLFAIAEFEGDEDAAEKLMEANEDSWRITLNRLRREKEQREEREALLKRAKELKIEIVESRPKMQYIATCDDPDSMEGDYMAATVDYKYIVGYMSETWSGWSLGLYGEPLHEEAEDPEVAARRKLADDYEIVARMVDVSIFEWVEEQFLSVVDGKIPAAFVVLESACLAKFDMQYWVKDAFEKMPFAQPEDHCLTSFIIGYANGRRFLSDYARLLAEDTIGDYQKDRLAEALKWVGYHEADGWEPNEGMAAFLGVVRSKVLEATEE